MDVQSTDLVIFDGVRSRSATFKQGMPKGSVLSARPFFLHRRHGISSLSSESQPLRRRHGMVDAGHGLGESDIQTTEGTRC